MPSWPQDNSNKVGSVADAIKDFSKEVHKNPGTESLCGGTHICVKSEKLWFFCFFPLIQNISSRLSYVYNPTIKKLGPWN